MAIHIRGPIAQMYLEVVAHEQVTDGGKTIYEIVLATIGGTDADEVVIRTGWRKALEEFPIGTRVGVQMNHSRPADAPPPPWVAGREAGRPGGRAC